MTTTPAPAKALTPEGIVADFIVAAYNSTSGKAAVLNGLTAGENGLKNALTSILTNAKPKGIFGTVYPLLEGSIESYVDGLIATYPPEALYALIDSCLENEAKALGG